MQRVHSDRRPPLLLMSFAGGRAVASVDATDELFEPKEKLWERLAQREHTATLGVRLLARPLPPARSPSRLPSH